MSGNQVNNRYRVTIALSLLQMDYILKLILDNIQDAIIIMRLMNIKISIVEVDNDEEKRVDVTFNNINLKCIEYKKSYLSDIDVINPFAPLHVVSTGRSMLPRLHSDDESRVILTSFNNGEYISMSSLYYSVEECIELRRISEDHYSGIAYTQSYGDNNHPNDGSYDIFRILSKDPSEIHNKIMIIVGWTGDEYDLMTIIDDSSILSCDDHASFIYRQDETTEAIEDYSPEEQEAIDRFILYRSQLSQ